MDGYLTKPPTLDRLRDTLDRWMEAAIDAIRTEWRRVATALETI